MPLTAPTGLAVSRLYRVQEGNGTSFKSFRVFGRITWANTETDAHTVELSVAGQKTYLPKGATAAVDVLVATFVAPEIAPKSVSIEVKLVEGGDSSTAATLTATIDGMSQASPTSELLVAAGSVNLLLPTWSGCAEFDEGLILFITRNNVTLAQPRARFHDTAFALPTDLIPEETYEVGWNLITRPLRAYMDPQLGAAYGPVQGLFSVTHIKSVTFTAADPTIEFAVVDEALKLVRNRPVRHMLKATRAATWEVTAGLPAGFAILAEPSGTYLVGAFTATGNHVLSLSATPLGGTAPDDTKTGKLTIAVFASDIGFGKKTTISLNPGWINNGLAYDTGSDVRVALASTPAPAQWRAVGLPMGVSIEPATGVITGRPTTEGRFMASIFAQADGWDESDPAVVTFTIRQGTGNTAPGTSAKARIPWILSRWDLVDLQILARSRKVESTLMEGDGDKAVLRAKIGDHLNFAAFYIDHLDAPFDLAPDVLRLKVRPADNLDTSLVLAEVTAPDPEGGIAAPDFDEITIEAEAEADTKVTITGLSSTATRVGGGDGEDDLVFLGRDAGKPWTFGFRGGDGATAFKIGETVTIVRASGFTALPLKGSFRVATIDATDDGADPWIVLDRVDPAPYYLLATSTGAKERQRLLEWVEDAKKNDPLACVGEIEWVKGGKTYSSQFFPIALELDVVRAG
jgi:hypothetical protein